MLYENLFASLLFRPNLHQFSRVFHIKYVPLYLCTFVMDTYSMGMRVYAQ